MRTAVRVGSLVVVTMAILVQILVGFGVHAQRAQIPGAPQRVSATDGLFTDRVIVSWAGSSGATRFEVYRSSSQMSRNYEQIGESTTHEYQDMTVVPGTTYWYKLTACNLLGCSDLSDADSGYAEGPMLAQPVTPGVNCPAASLLPPPENLKLTESFAVPEAWYLLPISQFSVPSLHLTWDKVQNATRYRIYRETGAKPSGRLVSMGVVDETTGTAYDDTDIASCRTYSYRVAACLDCGCGEYSQSVEWAAHPPTQAPTGVKATTNSEDQMVDVTWDPVPGATFYQLQISSGGNFALQDDYTTLEQNPVFPSDMCLPQDNKDWDVWRTPGGYMTRYVWGTTFTDYVYACCIRKYAVAACNDCGCGPASTQVKGWPEYMLPTPVLTASDGEFPDKVVLAWDYFGGQQYVIEWAPQKEGPFSPLVVSPDTGATTYVTQPASGQVLWYRIGEINRCACTWSAPDSGYCWTPPPPPTGIAASTSTSGNWTTVEIRWDAMGPPVERYEILTYNFNSGNWVKYATIYPLGNETQFVYIPTTKLGSGQSWGCRIRCCDSHGCGEMSPVISATAP